MNRRNRSTVLVAALIAFGITCLLTLSVAHLAYDREVERIEQFAVGKLQNRAGLQIAIYRGDQRYLDTVLDEFFEQPAVSSAALYRGTKTLLSGRDRDDPVSSSLPPLNQVRGDASIADTALTNISAGSASVDTGFWSAVLGGGTMHLSTPVISAVHAVEKNLQPEDFITSVKTTDNIKSRRVLGYLHLGIERSTLLTQVLGLAGQMFATCVVLILLGAAAIHNLARNMYAPLKQLRGLAADLKDGGPLREISVGSNRDFQEIAGVLNDISKGLKSRRAEAEIDQKKLNWQIGESQSKISERDDKLDQAAREISAAKSELHRAAHYDRLTSLPNQTLFREQLQQLLSNRDHGPISLLLLNLNDFRRINDSFDYSGGDVVMMAVAKRLAECAQESILAASDGGTEQGVHVYRLGGDEFAVLLNSVDPDNTGPMAQRLIDAIAQPIQVKDQEIVISSRMGIALAPTGTEDSEALIRAAGIAVRQAELSSTGAYLYYSDDLEEEDLDDLKLESQLRNAQKNRELELYYQPQVDATDGSIQSAEVLLRWNHPEQGQISPARFIPMAKRIGLLGALGKWAARTACAQLKAFREMGLELPQITINVSYDELENGFGETLIEALQQNDLEGSSVEVSLSQIVLMDEDSVAFRALETLSRKGVHLSLDNFGISSTPLNHLQFYPLNELKVDRSIVRQCDSNRDNAALLKTIIAIADTLDLRVVAEGIETEAEFSHVLECGARAMQGFLFSKPLPAEQFKELLSVPWYFMNQIQDMKANPEEKAS